MAVKIVTDSTCDLPKKMIEELDITIVPLKVLFGEEVLRDGIDISPAEFYTRMAKEKDLPTTSQVNPGEFIEVFTDILDQGAEIVGIFISSKLSGTYNSAVTAADVMNREGINIIDSLNASFGLGLQVIKAARLAKEGKPAGEIVEVIESTKGKVHLYGIIADLENLKKGGRLSSTGAFVGSVLGIKPLIAVADGKVIPIGKARGQKKAYKWVMAQLENQKIDLNNQVISIAHAADPGAMKEFKQILTEKYEIKEIIEMDIGSVIGTHTGPGCVGISCYSE